MHTLIPGDFPKILLTAPDDAHAEIYLHGAHVTSWITPDGRERLFLSERTQFVPGAAFRGGVPVVFPQFAGLGPMIKHGFARIMTWELVESQDDSSGTASAHFRLRDSDETRRIWDHGFQLDMTVTVGGMQLDMAFGVTHTGSQPFTFTAALHTYLRVDSIAAVEIEGLGGLAYREHGIDSAQEEPVLRIPHETDRMYWNIPGVITVHDGAHTLAVRAEGFPDAVVWNPGPTISDALVDMEPDGYQRMMCIEAAAIGQPVNLSPGETWHGSQHVTAS